MNVLRDELLDRNDECRETEDGEKEIHGGLAEEGDHEDDRSIEGTKVHSVSRKDIKVYLHDMVRDECENEFMYYMADNQVYKHKINRQIVVLGEAAHQKGLTSSKTRGSSCGDLLWGLDSSIAWKIHCRYTPSSNAVA